MRKIKFLLANIMMLVGITAQATTITWDAAKLNSMWTVIESTEPASQSKASDGITVTVAKTVSSAIYYTMEFGSDIMANAQGYFTFESSVGNISKIEINHSDLSLWYSGGTGWPGNYYSNGGTFTWSGTPAASVTLSGRQDNSFYSISSIVFTIEDPTVAVTGNSDGAAAPSYWATYYDATQGYTADANTTVYQAAVSGSSLALTEVTGREIPAGEAVILKSTAASITLTPATTTATTLSGNDLKGGTTVTSGCDAYTLSRGSEGNGAIGFYKYSGSLDGSKAHLEVASGAGARGFIGFGDGTTAIEAPTATVSIEDGETYDLTGRRIGGQPTRKGIYVRNGKKFIIK